MKLLIKNQIDFPEPDNTQNKYFKEINSKIDCD